MVTGPRRTADKVTRVESNFHFDLVNLVYVYTPKCVNFVSTFNRDATGPCRKPKYGMQEGARALSAPPPSCAPDF